VITGNTRVFAVIGAPVAHSLSPALHNAWFAAHGIDAVYVALRVPPGTDLGALVRGAGIAGFNATAPHKAAALAAADALTEVARATGAVNTLFRADGRWIGDNTDVEGFEHALGGPPAGRAVVLGSGGAARAVAHALRRMGTADVAIVPRADFGPATLAAAAQAALVVNCAAGAAAPALREWTAGAEIDPSRWFDLNYWDPVLPGTGEGGRRMLVFQAAVAFRHFTGIAVRGPELADALAHAVPRAAPPC
jgi:shikimate dehydrogenase